MVRNRIDLPDGIPILNSYYVYLTGGCNLACKHCWLAPTFQPHGDTGGHLKYELFKMAIDEGLPLGLSSVKLTGGEPLLHPDFIRIVDFLAMNSIGMVIETNGFLMSKELANKLKTHSTLNHISVSLDGAVSQTHDSFRGVQGSFDKACHAIGWLAEEGLLPQVIMSLHVDNVDEIESAVKLVEILGANSVKFNLIQSSGRGESLDNRGGVLGIDRLLQIGKWVETDLQKRTNLSLFYSWPMAFYGIEHLLSDGGYSCDVTHIMGILPTGQLALCGIGTEIPELCFGFLGVDRIESIWMKNPRSLNLRKTIRSELEGICHECLHKNRCKGMCVAQNYYESGHLTAPFWFCQNANEDGYFPTSRKLSS